VIQAKDIYPHLYSSDMFSYSKAMIKTVKTYDPSAPNALYIYFLYPGLIALRRHRIAHYLFKKGFKLIARIISLNTRKRFGIDIHPAATIGKGVFIDHGMGLVIGETAVVGDGCVLYHGVTLGAHVFDPIDRHPKLEDHVIVFTGAKIIGPITIGHHTKIGANAVVTKSCEAYSKLKGVPAHK